MKDFSFKFEGDFDTLVNFFLSNFFLKDFVYKIEGEFSILYCPLPYSLPSGSCANLTARRGAPGYTGGRSIKSVLYFFSQEFRI